MLRSVGVLLLVGVLALVVGFSVTPTGDGEPAAVLDEARCLTLDGAVLCQEATDSTPVRGVDIVVHERAMIGSTRDNLLEANMREYGPTTSNRVLMRTLPPEVAYAIVVPPRGAQSAWEDIESLSIQRSHARPVPRREVAYAIFIPLQPLPLARLYRT
jgi:hypothetical protein